MQGNERNQNSDIDKQFVDRAWNNMSDLLDREMPVVVLPQKSNNKKYLTLLLLLMIGFLMGIASMAIFGGQQEVPSVAPKVTPIPSHIPVADATEVIEMNDKSITENINTKRANTTIEKTITSVQSSSTKSASNANQKIRNQDVINLGASHQESSSDKIYFHANEKQKELFVVKRKNNIDSTRDKKIADHDLVNMENGVAAKEELNTDWKEESHTIVSENKLPETLHNYLASAELLNLPTTNMSKLEASPRTLDSEVILPKVVRWRLAAIGGVHLTPGYSGWEGGLLAEYQLNPRFAIQSGLTLSSLKKDINLNTYDESILDSSLEPDLPGEINDPGQVSVGDLQNNSVRGANGTNTYLSRLNYINTPLLLSYQPTSFMKIMLGMNLAYRFDFIDQVLDNGGEKSLDYEQSSETTFSSPDQDSNSLKNGIKKTDLSGVFGIGFYPTKNTGIDLRYHLGFQDYSDDDYFTVGKVDTNQSLRLSLIHYFGK